MAKNVTDKKNQTGATEFSALKYEIFLLHIKFNIPQGSAPFYLIWIDDNTKASNFNNVLCAYHINLHFFEKSRNL